jgi:hypothetical protein
LERLASTEEAIALLRQGRAADPTYEPAFFDVAAQGLPEDLALASTFFLGDALRLAEEPRRNGQRENPAVGHGDLHTCNAYYYSRHRTANARFASFAAGGDRGNPVDGPNNVQV